MEPTRAVPVRRPEATRFLPPAAPAPAAQPPGAPGPAAQPPGASAPVPTPSRLKRLRRPVGPAPGPVPAVDVGPPRRKRRWFLRKRLLVPLGLLGLVAVLAPDGSTPPPDRGSQLNTPVRDGNLEFVVRSVKCGIPTVGSGLLKQTAKGQFCLADLRVTNVKDDGRTLYEPFQKLVDSTGDKHSADIRMRVVYRDQSLWDKVEPGRQVSGTMVFDIPAGARADRLELHDGPVSGGVTVRLR